MIYLFIMIDKSIAVPGCPLIFQSYAMGSIATILISGRSYSRIVNGKRRGILLIIVDLVFSIYLYFEAGSIEWLAFLVSVFPHISTEILFVLSNLIKPKSE